MTSGIGGSHRLSTTSFRSRPKACRPWTWQGITTTGSGLDQCLHLKVRPFSRGNLWVIVFQTIWIWWLIFFDTCPLAHVEQSTQSNLGSLFWSARVRATATWISCYRAKVFLYCEIVLVRSMVVSSMHDRGTTRSPIVSREEDILCEFRSIVTRPRAV